MAELPDAEVRRLLKYLRNEVGDAETLAEIEDELRSEFAAEYIREPEILRYFRNEIIELRGIRQLKIIKYTHLRMVQRGIGKDDVPNLFEKFLDFCKSAEIIVTVGAYNIYGKPVSKKSSLTLRIDVDDVSENSSKAHTVTVFVGRGDTSETLEINLPS